MTEKDESVSPRSAIWRRLIGELQRVRSFIEYSRYVLEPGKATFPDQFPKQVDADEAMARADEVLTVLLACAEAPETPELDIWTSVNAALRHRGCDFRIDQDATGQAICVPVPDVYSSLMGAEAPATTPDGKYFFPLTGKPPCPDCGQPEGVKLHLGSTGYGVTSGFQHTPECKQNFCPHGIAWSEDCAHCDMARIEEGE